MPRTVEVKWIKLVNDHQLGIDPPMQMVRARTQQVSSTCCFLHLMSQSPNQVRIWKVPGCFAYEPHEEWLAVRRAHRSKSKCCFVSQESLPGQLWAVFPVRRWPSDPMPRWFLSNRMCLLYVCRPLDQASMPACPFVQTYYLWYFL